MANPTAAIAAAHGQTRRSGSGLWRSANVSLSLMRNTGTGSAIFLIFCAPIGSKRKASFFSTSLATLPETQIPPGSASCSSRVAMPGRPRERPTHVASAARRRCASAHNALRTNLQCEPLPADGVGSFNRRMAANGMVRPCSCRISNKLTRGNQ
jgi:hypothetical protein